MTDTPAFSIRFSEEDKGFIATCEKYPGLSAFGDTEEEALSEAGVAYGAFEATAALRDLMKPDSTIYAWRAGPKRLTISGQI